MKAALYAGAAVALACAQPEELAQGAYSRRLRDDIPLTSIRVVDARKYEADFTVARLRGTYRIDHDSVFFDEQRDGKTLVSLAGVVRGDTLVLRIVGLAAIQNGPDVVRLVRSP